MTVANRRMVAGRSGDRRLSTKNTVSIALLVLAVLLVVVPRLPMMQARATTALTASGPITHISIAAIDVDSRVVEAGQVKQGRKLVWEVPGYAVAHDRRSALPGQGTNIVLYGHNNVQGAVFRDLNKLGKGDVIRLRTKGGQTYSYGVSQIHIFLEDGATPEQQRRNASYMDPTSSERLTIISCWPNEPWPRYRIIVTARPVAK